MDGIILVDKPKGWTSHDVVSKLRKQLNTKKIGHTGTLDPMATGLLVVCLGNATKFVKYLTEHDKEYIAEITLGVKTNTDDITGEVIDTAVISTFEKSILENILKSFVGTMSQIPPVASAIKVNGKRAYEFIHKQQDAPTMQPRIVTFHAIKLVSNPVFIDDKCLFSIRVVCSKGTYIRALARDIGQSMNVPATLSNLRRTKVGQFEEKEASLMENLSIDTLHLINPIHYLGFQEIHIDDEYLFKVANGAFLPMSIFPNKEETLVCDKTGKPLAIYTLDQTKNIMRLSVLL
ncbi:MAG: tRNA pseudouridine(55) synthase TruB [Tenericutes bacterium HGW-Tenericutes-1]|jgi:tRNA pseudouridine55 synthase|nr:MAG: tRNA pseudouridine(55) synthase TruB [Tenericutes bacterium HGW-Tenericutes-1]